MKYSDYYQKLVKDKSVFVIESMMCPICGVVFEISELITEKRKKGPQGRHRVHCKDCKPGTRPDAVDRWKLSQRVCRVCKRDGNQVEFPRWLGANPKICSKCYKPKNKKRKTKVSPKGDGIQ